MLINLNNTAVEGYDFEDLYNNPERLFLQGYCDEVIQKLVDDVGWSKEFKKLISKN